MEEIREKLDTLRDLSAKLMWEERRRQQHKIINKTISLVAKLEEADKKLKSPSHTSGDIVKHMKLLTELRLLYRADEVQSPVNCIKREMELINKLYGGLMETYRAIIDEFTAGGGNN